MMIEREREKILSYQGKISCIIYYCYNDHNIIRTIIYQAIKDFLLYSSQLKNEFETSNRTVVVLANCNRVFKIYFAQLAAAITT